MNCREAKSLIRGSAEHNQSLKHSAFDHISKCTACNRSLGEEAIVARVIGEAARLQRESSEASSLPPTFMMQLRARIRREGDRMDSTRRSLATTWESAILQFQKVVYAGGAAALLLAAFVVYSDYRDSSNSSRDTGLMESLLSNRSERMIALQGEPLSQDEVLFAVLTEETENARR
jgi:hypothetical protein